MEPLKASAVSRARSRALPRTALVAMLLVVAGAGATTTLYAAYRGRVARAAALGADVRALAAHHAHQLAVALAAVGDDLRAAAALPEALPLDGGDEAARARFVAALAALLGARDPLWDRLLVVRADGDVLAAVTTGRLLDRLYPPIGLERHAPASLHEEGDLLLARATGGGAAALADAAMRFADLAHGAASLAGAATLARARYVPRAGTGYAAVANPMARVGARTGAPGDPAARIVAADVDVTRLLGAARAGMALPADAEILLLDGDGSPLALADAGGPLADPAIGLRAPPTGRRCWSDSFFGCAWAAMLAARRGPDEAIALAAGHAGERADVVPAATAGHEPLGLFVAAYRPASTLAAELRALAPVAAPATLLAMALVALLLSAGTRRIRAAMDTLAADVRQVWTDVALPEEVAASLSQAEALRRVVDYVSRMLEDTRALMTSAFGLAERYWVEEAFGDIRGTMRRLLEGALQTTVVAAERDTARALQKKEEEFSRSLSATLAELEKAHRDLKEAQATMLQREKMASLGQLVAGIAHEINNPVNFISQNVAALDDYLGDLRAVLDAYERHGTFDEPARKAIDETKAKHDFEVVLGDLAALLRDVKAGAERTRKIVQDLRSFSRLDEAELKEVDLHDGLETTLNLLRNALKNRIEIVRDYQAPHSLRCYAGQLNQVFMNVLDNAQAAMGATGTLTVRTFVRGADVVVAIRDTGPGIPPAVLARIFEPFFTTKEVGRGTGLGLSISHSIVERHGGRIEVDTAPGQGTEFRIVLPASGPPVS